ncbi:MAG: HD domain-containing protein [Prevotella sp.]|nr:HD domain-containing protein [Prevotella sp.]MDY6229964.1 HD domain-containing protein [Prevotella sp.]
MTDSKIINDAVFGFIRIPKGLLLDIVKHSTVQRLSRIRQNGLASVVYPGAQHTRFQHSLGAFHLMSEAINSLRQKGIFIFDSEAEAVEAAILLHDVGHGPFSHVLEHTLMNGISHEEMSLLMMEEMNREFNGELSLAIKIFKDEYNKRFLHQLISSQLDMDRLDYLCRDSFFCGVTDGNIGSDRIIKMLDVVDDRLVVSSKGIYSIENYLTSRRLMYWQVYLHKTTVACEKMLVNTLLRARFLTRNGVDIFASPALKYFLKNEISHSDLSLENNLLKNYKLLDDNDIWCAVKVWSQNEDKILSLLSTALINRCLFKVEISDKPFTEEYINELREKIAKKYNLKIEDTTYLYSINTIHKDMYDVNDDNIDILYKDGTIKDITEVSEILNVSLLSKKIRKYYLCYHRY